MGHDIYYLHADGEVEAEHLWVNEWAEGVTLRVVDAPAPVPPPVDAPLDLSGPLASDDSLTSDLLMRDLAEIARVRDGLEAAARHAPKPAGAVARLRHLLSVIRTR
jgi:hypothetical protein